MRISDWSSDVCSSDLDITHERAERQVEQRQRLVVRHFLLGLAGVQQGQRQTRTGLFTHRHSSSNAGKITGAPGDRPWVPTWARAAGVAPWGRSPAGSTLSAAVASITVPGVPASVSRYASRSEEPTSE